MSCSNCFTDFLAKCNDVINVYAQLPALALYDSYRWVITDKFRNKYEGYFTVDADGFWQIPVDELPDGLLTQYSGDFSLQVYDSGCKPVKFKVAQEYDCIDFHIKGGTFVKDNLGCSFSCTPSPASLSSIIPFTDTAVFEITYSPYLGLYGNAPTVQVYHLIEDGVYQLVSVSIQQIFVDGVLTEIEIDNGGVQTGYVILS